MTTKRLLCFMWVPHVCMLISLPIDYSFSSLAGSMSRPRTWKRIVCHLLNNVLWATCGRVWSLSGLALAGRHAVWPRCADIIMRFSFQLSCCVGSVVFNTPGISALAQRHNSGGLFQRTDTPATSPVVWRKQCWMSPPNVTYSIIIFEFF